MGYGPGSNGEAYDEALDRRLLRQYGFTLRPLGRVDVRGNRSGNPAHVQQFPVSDAIIAQRLQAITPRMSSYDLEIGVVGCGIRGLELAETMTDFSGLRIEALCEIDSERLERASARLRAQGHAARGYSRFEELVAQEGGLDAVVIATPDFQHAPQSIAALGAGLHVYCEAPMAHTPEQCRAMLHTCRQTGKLLQVGHAQRSDPAARIAVLELAHEDKLFGTLVQAQAHFNRRMTGVQPPRPGALDAGTLNASGFDTMEQLRRWRWYRRYSPGPFAAFAADSIGLFNWAFGSTPGGVLASGAANILAGIEHADNAMAILAYDSEAPRKHAMLTFNASLNRGGNLAGINGDLGGFYLDGNSVIPATVHFEVSFESRELRKRAAKQGKIASAGPDTLLEFMRSYPDTRQFALDVNHTYKELPQSIDAIRIVAPAHKPSHYWHLANFFDAVQSGAPLHCPPEVALPATLAAFECDKALYSGEMHHFAAGDFEA